VKVGECPSEQLKFRWLYAAGSEQAVKLTVAAELAHAHGMLNNLARSADLSFSIRCRDCAHLKIKVRGEAPIEAHFLAAKETSPFQRTHVDERVAHRAFDLVREIPGQQHPGHMCFNQLNDIDRMRISPRS
jgi:hypothetical protein